MSGSGPRVGNRLCSNVVFYSVTKGTVLCDIILLNFLKGAEQYKAKKFEEVRFTTALVHI